MTEVALKLYKDNRISDKNYQFLTEKYLVTYGKQPKLDTIVLKIGKATKNFISFTVG